MFIFFFITFVFVLLVSIFNANNHIRMIRKPYVARYHLFYNKHISLCFIKRFRVYCIF